jgi:hypothetical protein
MEEEEEEGKEDEAKERTKILISIMPNEQQIKEVSGNWGMHRKRN